MKKLISTATALLILTTFLPAVLAAHSSSIELNPKSWESNTVSSLEITLTNSKDSIDNIVKLLVETPVDENGNALYEVKDDMTLPSGWTPLLSYQNASVRSVEFSTTGTGLRPSSSIITFTLNQVRSPSATGSFFWKFTTTDSKGEIFEGAVTTSVNPGPLKNFVISGEPEKVKINVAAKMNVTSYNEFGFVKFDYNGTIEVSSTDANALIVPKIYTLKTDDNGKKEISVRFQTAGNHTITVVDKETGVSQISKMITVLPGTPSDLSVTVNQGQTETDRTLVTLIIQTTDAADCRYSNDQILWTNYEAYATSKEWNLSPGEGTKTVYMQCRNEYGESGIFSDTIEFRIPKPVEVPKEPEQPRFSITGLFGLSTSILVAGLALIISIISLAVSLMRRQKKS